jgi:hypothetical protein
MAADDWADRSEAKRTTLAEALHRNEAERTDGKKGARQERQRIAAWTQHELAQRSLEQIRADRNLFPIHRNART